MEYQQYWFGRFLTSPEPLSPGQARELLDEAQKIRPRFSQVPLDVIIGILEAAGALWADPAYPPRRRVLEVLPPQVGFHPSMAALALDSLAAGMRRPALERMVRGHLAGPAFLDGFVSQPALGGYLLAQPLGVVLHVSPGNVFVGGADSLVAGFITKNVNLLKVSGTDPVFPLLFAHSIRESDPGGLLADSFAVVSFAGGDREVERVFKTGCQGIVIWGSQETVQAYREELGPDTRLIEHGHRLGFGLVTARGAEWWGIPRAAADLARDVAMWEQRACSSPQRVFVAAPVLDALAPALARALEELQTGLPRGPLGVDEHVEILRARELARTAQAAGEGSLISSPGGDAWTVIVDAADRPFTPSPLNRCIHLSPFSSLDQVWAALSPLGGMLQSAGLLAHPQELDELTRALARLGVTRITSLGGMYRGNVALPHDGAFALEQLTRWVSREDSGGRQGSESVLVCDAPAPQTWERLRRQVEYARARSPYYQDRLKDLELRQSDHFLAFPTLNGDDLHRHTPPRGEGILTAPLKDSYVFCSGGSTGKPKFSFYTYAEFEQVTEMMAEIYRLGGISREDTVANLFMAGNLWTSFIVADKALERIGCLNLPIAGNADLDLVLRFLGYFRPTALLGLPSIIIHTAEEIRRRGLDLTFKTVLYGGEQLGEEARAFLTQTLGVERVASAGYASVDAGPIGFQCPDSAGALHHLLDCYQYLEVLDPDTLTPRAPGQVGELVVTGLSRRLMPLIRYRTGDRGRIRPGTCPCGRSSVRFELLGRCDDCVRVGTVSLYSEDFESILAGFPQASSLFQVESSREGTRDVVVVRVEEREPVSDREGLAARMTEVMLREREELAEAVRKGWLARLEVRLVPTGGIPPILRTGKIRKFVDRRVPEPGPEGDPS